MQIVKAPTRRTPTKHKHTVAEPDRRVRPSRGRPSRNALQALPNLIRLMDAPPHASDSVEEPCVIHETCLALSPTEHE
eukprot:CAMPEP_0181226470 /NCGR_PEP_ID=MMETSP1096-20121128/32275_1 /TAXON_ID=156174 ORGANISM="Chrysochromulina ericina, Strain CCMP281" /NCGR_SAMPLE_ID=MMETSP1096 /ASSEMBLY_ACC=CAM_ASM_000453 /LENGTH=77 /DNA_ID=CAMNT_0023319817 /DNA_START=609 /DNA_END=842 /DNA_ORIENTATION=-